MSALPEIFVTSFLKSKTTNCSLILLFPMSSVSKQEEERLEGTKSRRDLSVNFAKLHFRALATVSFIHRQSKVFEMREIDFFKFRIDVELFQCGKFEFFF